MNDSPLISKAKVELMGRQYTLKGDVDPDYMKNLADYINGKIQEIKELAPQADPLRLVLLASLNIVDELFQAKTDNSNQEMLSSDELVAMQEKTKHLLEMLEDGLIGEYWLKQYSRINTNLSANELLAFAVVIYISQDLPDQNNLYAGCYIRVQVCIKFLS